MKYILSYGGGVNSTALLIYIIMNKLPLDYVVFADTGDEMPETYKYLKHIKTLLKKYNTPFKIVKVRSGESLSERCKRRKVIPSQVWRWCTRDMKVTPIHAFYRTLKTHIYEYMGIDYDEIRRMKDSRVDYVTKLYPLIDNKIGRDGCIKIIKDQGLPIPVKSGCYFCPFNNKERWNELKINHPDLYQKSLELEQGGKHYPAQRLIRADSVESPCGGECMV
jgi:3'-phosphoadenosine 5'-phosphosulfate sulfotransferase (PAPS reductase)/FAD synthetase